MSEISNLSWGFLIIAINYHKGLNDIISKRGTLSRYHSLDTIKSK